MKLLRILTSSLMVGAMCLPVLAQDPPKPGAGEGNPPRAPRAPRAPRDPAAPPGEGPGMPGGPGGAGGPANPGMRPMMTPEQSKAAWELEATHLAKTLGFSGDQTKATVAAYTDARKSQMEAMEKLRQEVIAKAQQGGEDGAPRRGGMGAEMQKAFADLNKTEKAKLESALSKSLSADQVSKALPALGSFNVQWDAMTNTLVGFKLDAAKNDEAMTATQTYVTAFAKAMENEDREASRAANQEARKALGDTMKKVLSEEQLGQFQRYIGGGRAGGRPGGAGGRGEGAGDGAGAGGNPGDGAGGGAGGGRGGRGGGRGNGGGAGEPQN